MSTPPSGNPGEQNPYGQENPYGQQPPAYGQQPPAYGQQPPAYGQQPPYGQPPSYPYGGGYNATPAGPPPPNHLVWAIISIFLCTLPGIVAIVFATQVNTKWSSGDAAGAQDASNKARTWALVATILGGIGVVVWIALFATGVITTTSYTTRY